jgi:hypothetical protein
VVTEVALKVMGTYHWETQMFIFLSIAPSQTNTRLAWLRNGALYTSLDAGANWTYLSLWWCLVNGVDLLASQIQIK